MSQLSHQMGMLQTLVQAATKLVQMTEQWRPMVEYINRHEETLVRQNAEVKTNSAAIDLINAKLEGLQSAGISAAHTGGDGQYAENGEQIKIGYIDAVFTVEKRPLSITQAKKHM